MKGRREFDVALSPDLVRDLCRYIEHFRPILLARSPVLWIGAQR
jgi:hypothetical protein